MPLDCIALIPESPVLTKITSEKPKEGATAPLENAQKLGSKDEFTLLDQQKSSEKKRLEMLLTDKSTIYVKRD